MPTDLTFVATNPDGSTVSLKPIEYRADWPHMGHQRLSFQCFDGQGIDERATIKVMGDNPNMPVFCGWFDKHFEALFQVKEAAGVSLPGPFGHTAISLSICEDLHS